MKCRQPIPKFVGVFWWWWWTQMRDCQLTCSIMLAVTLCVWKQRVHVVHVCRAICRHTPASTPVHVRHVRPQCVCACAKAYQFRYTALQFSTATLWHTHTLHSITKVGVGILSAVPFCARFLPQTHWGGNRRAHSVFAQSCYKKASVLRLMCPIMCPLVS